mmetsp:Transcript_95506/g.179726  ORF Transcript_95506/g.179726 Transcript_95506/m.179726 type:complete len:234 (-) Transcript_95506:283-984(-)
MNSLLLSQLADQTLLACAKICKRFEVALAEASITVLRVVEPLHKLVELKAADILDAGMADGIHAIVQIIHGDVVKVVAIGGAVRADANREQALRQGIGAFGGVLREQLFKATIPAAALRIVPVSVRVLDQHTGSHGVQLRTGHGFLVRAPAIHEGRPQLGEQLIAQTEQALCLIRIQMRHIVALKVCPDLLHLGVLVQPPRHGSCQLLGVTASSSGTWAILGQVADRAERDVW